MARRWMIVLMAVCVLAAVAVIVHTAGRRPVPDVIRAQRFELVDTEGAVWAVLKFEHSEKRPVLEMYDGSGHARVQLCGGASVPGDTRGPGLDLMHRNGFMPAIALRVTDGPEEGYGRANLVLTAEQDGARAGMHASSDGARLEVRDGQGRTIWTRP